MSKAPQITGVEWINSDPLDPNYFRGKVVLVDFWTYSCVNCLRTLTFVKEWWEKYKNHGLVIIGVHSPEFTFEEKYSNVEKAARELGVSWPVVLDNDKSLWNAFNNKYWPAKYLLDKTGNIVYEHFGEDEYEQTEEAIRNALGLSTEISANEHVHGSTCFTPTPELYLGYERGHIEAQSEVQLDSVTDFSSPKTLSEGQIALDGEFYLAKEYVESRKNKASIAVSFHATEVNLVLAPVEQTSELKVFLGEEPISAAYRGSDVKPDGTVAIESPRMYNLLRTNKETTSTLKVLTGEASVRAYAFTFSGCEEKGW